MSSSSVLMLLKNENVKMSSLLYNEAKSKSLSAARSDNAMSSVGSFCQ